MPFFVNVSCPKVKNPEGFVIINKIKDEYNHILNSKIVEYEDAK
ncbi:6072_t:CDS:1, partial [Racocetra fulgida]